MPAPETNMEITNYDVLADEVATPISENENDIGLSLAAHSFHVGNNRLEVLCNIHNQAFADHEAKGENDSSASIVEKILDIVQNQCVPKGRFLQRDKNGEWKEVEEEKRKLLVRQALSHINNSNQSSLVDSRRQQKKGSEEEQKAMQEDDAEKKRRRRSSLLRRSVSSSMLPRLVGGKIDDYSFDDKKKSIRKALELSSDDGGSLGNSPGSSRSSSPSPELREKQTPAQREKTKTSSLPGYGRSRTVEVGTVSTQQASRRPGSMNLDRKPIIKETQKMDVLFNTPKTALLPGADLHGNNRLKVMVSIQSAAYIAADDEGKEKMAEDMVETIENFWGGRVLAQVPTRRARRGGGGAPPEEAYVQLEKMHAVQGIKHLLSGEGDPDNDESEDNEANVSQGRRASLKAIQALASASDGSASESILPSKLPPLPANMQHLRSQAVKSLQKRKQRQGLNSKIRGLTATKAAIFQDGNSNASVVSSSMNTTAGSVPPPTVVAPVPTTVTSNLHQQPSDPYQPSDFRHYRQTSSGASVASSATHMSTGTAGQGSMQRQPSLGGMSTASSNTTMTMNTVNAARTISSLTAGQAYNIQNVGAPIPHNMMVPSAARPDFAGYNVPPNMQTTGPAQQFHQQPHLSMPSVPEDFNHDFNNYGGQVYSDYPANHIQYNPGRTGVSSGNRTSLLNSTGSDGLPRFGQGEVDLLMKGLEMAEQQQQEELQHQEQQQNRDQRQQQYD